MIDETIGLPIDRLKQHEILVQNIKKYIKYLDTVLLNKIIVDYDVYNFSQSSFREIICDDNKIWVYEIKVNCGVIDKTYKNILNNPVFKSIFEFEGLIDISFERDSGIELIYDLSFFNGSSLMESINRTSKYNL